MINRVAKLLDNKGENYIIPFFWQHGEEEPVLREYMGVINACGIARCALNAGRTLISRPEMVARYGHHYGRGQKARHEGMAA